MKNKPFDAPTIITTNPEELGKITQTFPAHYYDYLKDQPADEDDDMKIPQFQSSSYPQNEGEIKISEQVKNIDSQNVEMNRPQPVLEQKDDLAPQIPGTGPSKSVKHSNRKYEEDGNERVPQYNQAPNQKNDLVTKGSRKNKRGFSEQGQRQKHR